MTEPRSPVTRLTIDGLHVPATERSTPRLESAAMALMDENERLAAERDAAVARAERAEVDRDRLDAALTEIHQRAHLAFKRLGGETLRSITERAWRALAYPDAATTAPSEPQETTP